MKNFLQEAAVWSTEALETACGWALYVAIAYAILFADITGRGTLWSHVFSMAKEGKTVSAVAPHDSVRVITLGSPVERRDDGLQMIEYSYLSKPAGGGQERALVAVNDSRQVSALADVPSDADASASKDWKRGIKGEMRSFAVYGNGSESSSASGEVRTYAAASPAAIAAASVPQSAYRQGAAAASRPAISSRARPLSLSGDGSVRNFAGK